MKSTDVLLQFDMVDDYSDHHYAKKDVGSSLTKCSSLAYIRIMNEWKQLHKNLPESITVQVYDQRIDLMRAVIIGAAGTPYHDALFVFDLQFPKDYPFRPLNVFYHSFGYRLNPNMNESGEVCFDLLNTLSTDINLWSPSSNVLHVLLSIQAVILNEKPYHNQPGNDGLHGQTLLCSQARSYNEDVFLMSRRTMLCLLRKPPKGFESFIVRHFRDRGYAILEACTAYAKGLITIGYYDQNDDSSDIEIKVSDKFKASVMTLYPKLFWAFTRLGTGAELGVCEKQFVGGEFLKVLTQLSVVKRELDLLESPPKAKGGYHPGIKKKIIGNLKKIFGLKKKKNAK